MIIVDLQYFPPVTFFSTSFEELDIVFPLYDQYRKMTFRNRCIIAGANNLIELSVPIEGGREQHRMMKEIRISNAVAWQRQHWRSLHSAYNRSPFFEHYGGELETLYRRPGVWLAEWNQRCMEWAKEKTGWKPAFTFAGESDGRSEAGPGMGGTVKDFRDRLLPRNYLDFPAPRYPQVFESVNGFQANLSVLDLLFNTGPECLDYLRGKKGNAPSGPDEV